MPALLWMFLGQFNLGMEIIHNQTKVIKQQGWVICQLRRNILKQNYENGGIKQILQHS